MLYTLNFTLLYVNFVSVKVEQKKKSAVGISGRNEMEKRKQNALFFDRGM